MGVFSNIRAKAAERAAEAERIAEEKRKAEIVRLSQMSEKDILIEIHLMLTNYGKRISDLESQVSSMSGEVSQMYVNDIIKD